MPETSASDASDPTDEQPEKEINEVYDDRNLLACALAESTSRPAGWKPDPNAPDEWAIVWIESPEGQVSWHVPKGLAEALVENRAESEYDGYDRAEKNDRLQRWTEQGCP